MQHCPQYRCHSSLCRTLHMYFVHVWRDSGGRMLQIGYRLAGNALSPWFSNIQGGVHDFRPQTEHPRTHPITDISELLSHLLWKLGLWMIWESFPNESIVSTGSSVWAVLCPGWSGTSSPGYEGWTTVLILGRNCARAGAPRSRPCSLCRWFPRLSRAPCLTDM